jgi:hypothetical protein
MYNTWRLLRNTSQAPTARRRGCGLALYTSAVLTLCSCGVVLASDGSGPVQTSGRGDSLRFRFDADFQASPALSFRFSRGMPIALPSGVEYGPDDPRFAPPSVIVPAPVVTLVRDTASHTDLLGSGLDHDGVTPLLMLYDRTQGLVDVFTVAGKDLMQAEIGGIGRNRTVIGSEQPDDLLQGAVANKTYAPVSAAVCHGLIVVLCTVWEDAAPPTGDWQQVAMAFVTSQDAGLTWELFFEDSPVDEGWQRGREWCMQNWWPMERQPSPTEAFFTATDYRHNLGALGGRAYLFAASRPGPGTPWSLAPVEVVFEQGGKENEHFHVSAAAPLPDGGMCVITSVGDSQFINRVVNQKRPDREYNQPGWTTTLDYHGMTADFDVGDWGREANQFVGCAPGPTAGDLLVGSDLNSEQILLLPASDLEEAQPRTQHVYGLGLSNDNDRSEVFLIRTPTPEAGGPYFSRFAPRSTGNPPAMSRRVLYSPDGVDWVQLYAPGYGNFRGCVHGEHVYIDSFFNSGGVRRLDIPQLLQGQPLRVGAGGRQRGVANPSLTPGSGGTVTALEKNEADMWVFEGEPLSPQPPCTGQVYHFAISRFDTSIILGNIRPAGDATDVGQLVPGPALQVRTWIMSNSPAGCIHPGVELRDGGGTVHFMRRPVYAAVDTWFPVLGVRDTEVTPGRSIYLRLLSSSGGARDDADFFLALDSVVEGVGLADYPLPQDDSPDATGVVCPDELAAVTGFACDEEWTITLAGQLPPESWDSKIETTGYWPLATLVQDELNYIELGATSADPQECRLVASVVAEGVEALRLESSITYWLRGSSVLVSLGRSLGVASGYRMTVSVGGTKAHEATTATNNLRDLVDVRPREVRFGSHHGVSGDGTAVHVTPMLWWGGEIHPTKALNVFERQDLLKTLTFLGPVSGDIDGDGDVDQSDLGLLLIAYGIDDGGDVDGDGDTDQSDLGLLLDNYGYGT